MPAANESGNTGTGGGIPDREIAFRAGRGLVFVLAPMRGGTTLLRKVLDSHPMIYSPAETWFLLPLLNLWSGQGASGTYDASQAATALRGHLTLEQFVTAARAFAASFYAQTMPKRASVFVDKTPPYLDICDTLPTVFPEARYLVLTRDPRSTLWSRLTWQHAVAQPIEEAIRGVATDARRQVAFLGAFPSRSLRVSYERLCTEPVEEAARVCEFLGLPRHDAMTEYGAVPHHEGYGDARSRAFDRPHTESLCRWAGHLGEREQAMLAGAFAPGELESLGYPELADCVATGA